VELEQADPLTDDGNQGDYGIKKLIIKRVNY